MNTTSDEKDGPSEKQPTKRRRIRAKSADPCPIRRRASHIRATALGISGRQYRWLKRFNAPPIVYHTFLYCMMKLRAFSQDIDAIDFFAGVANVKKGLTMLRYRACAYDIINDEIYQNLLTDEGWLTAFAWVARLKDTGFTHWGTVCSTWVWISRHSTGRSKQRPMGDPSSESTVKANIMVSCT